ncbi:hypothetical protein R2F25_03460 [Streptomyces sp. UP1A-1]|nr:hypothetical protein [Streptomyces sp. UP1A-1]
MDDAHLWDAPARSALSHAAERLHTAGRVALLLSVAGHRAVDPEFARLPVVRLDPLAPSHADALLDEVTDGSTDPAVREHLLAEAEGNPALLLALVRAAHARRTARTAAAAPPDGRRRDPGGGG